MPYSTTERNELDFYKALVSDLRTVHINEIKDYIPKNFRDGQGVLQSFEDIVSTEGLENANFEDGGALYENALFNPNMESTTNEQQLQYYDGIRNSNLTLQDKKLKKYTKGELLNNTVNRTFTELDTSSVSTSTIPSFADFLKAAVEGSFGDALKGWGKKLIFGTINLQTLGKELKKLSIENGDIITPKIENKMLLWLIEDNKKRLFLSKEDFYSSVYADKEIVELPPQYIRTIDNGKIIALETEAPYNPGEVTTTTLTIAQKQAQVYEYFKSKF